MMTGCICSIDKSDYYNYKYSLNCRPDKFFFIDFDYLSTVNFAHSHFMLFLFMKDLFCAFNIYCSHACNNEVKILFICKSETVAKFLNESVLINYISALNPFNLYKTTER